MEKEKVHWQNPQLDLVKSFQGGYYSKLTKYAETNELELMNVWANQDIEASRKTLKLASALLGQFERFLNWSDEKSLTAFKLGELYGHVQALNKIRYEEDLNALAMQRFIFSKSVLSEFNDFLLKSILQLISKKDEVCLSELSNQFCLDLKDLEKILNTFELCGFINSYKTIMKPIYSLTDTGRYLVKQFES